MTRHLLTVLSLRKLGGEGHSLERVKAPLTTHSPGHMGPSESRKPTVRELCLNPYRYSRAQPLIPEPMWLVFFLVVFFK